MNKKFSIFLITAGLTTIVLLLIMSLALWNQSQEKILPNNNNVTSMPNRSDIVLNKTMSKIDPLLVTWMSSDNRQDFARKSGLVFYNNTIAVYVYLESNSSVSQIPHEIQITGMEGGIVVARVTPEQIMQLAKLNPVKNISPPTLSRPN